MSGIGKSVGNKAGVLWILCLRVGTEKAQKKGRLFKRICLGLVLIDDGFGLTFYRYMSNSPKAILTNGIIDKSKSDLERSVNICY